MGRHGKTAGFLASRASRSPDGNAARYEGSSRCNVEARQNLLVSDEDAERSITVEQRLRPLRLAFLIEHDSRSQALTAIETCCALWGGALCPIIPVYRRTPRWLNHHTHPWQHASVDVTGGWIEAFEPDYVVEAVSGLAAATGYDSQFVVPLSQVQDPTPHATGGYGVSAGDVYSTAYEQVYRFAQRHPEDAVLCDPARRQDALWTAAMFGTLPEMGPFRPLRDMYQQAFDPNIVSLDGGTFARFFLTHQQPITPLGATMWGVDADPRIDWRSLYLLFDPRSVLDIAHLWSLRAYGLRFYPVPLPHLAVFAMAVRAAVADGFMAGVRLQHPMVISPAPSVQPRQLEELRAALVDPDSDNEMLDPVTGNIIEIWDPSALRERRLTRVRASSAQSSLEVRSRYRNITFDALEPPLRRAHGGYDNRRWAVAVRPRDMRVHSELAEVFPPELRNVSDLLQRTDMRQPVTTTSEGLIVRGDAYGTTQWWILPTGTDMFVHWLDTLGITARVSSAGRTAVEFINALGGPLVAIHVGDPDLVRLIGRAAEDTTGSGIISFAELKATLSKIHKNHRPTMEQQAGFLTRTVLQVHMSAVCPTCEQKNWYAPADLATELQCRRCLRTFTFPAAQPPGRGDWGYRPIGPFAVGGYAHGAYTVSLALRFFLLRGMISDAHSWTVSLEAEAEGKAFEVDFGLWLRPGLTEEEKPSLLFGEAKTFNRFEAADFARAKALLRRFPEAHMVFATLRDSLEDQERRRLVRLVCEGARAENRGRVIVLTATELCDYAAISVPFSWKQLSGRHAEVAERYGRAQFDLQALSDATLELYADWRWPTPAHGESDAH
jgi:hypothetical protein